MNQNVDLISEINDLTRERKNLHDDTKNKLKNLKKKK